MDNALDKAWTDRPEIIRGYYERSHVHQRLCDEVKYILEKKIKSLCIEIGHLTSRTKSLESFCEKVERKRYDEPFKDVTDLSGVRIVYLYASDKIRLERLIEEEFDVHDKVDKIIDQDVERFGYGALHYVISLKEQHAGARYDDLRSVNCEIQVRTILQDAWAIVAHHLSYKHENDIPRELKRKLNALSGLFETADDQFELINSARLDYQNKIKKSMISDLDLSLDTDLNLDSLLAYMSWKFPERERGPVEDTANLLEELSELGYNNLKDVDHVINKCSDAVFAYEDKYPPSDPNNGETGPYWTVGVIRVVLNIEHDDYRYSMNEIQQGRIGEFMHLVNR